MKQPGVYGPGFGGRLDVETCKRLAAAVVGVDRVGGAPELGIAEHEIAVQALGGIVDFHRAFEQVDRALRPASLLPVAAAFRDRPDEAMALPLARSEHPGRVGLVAEEGAGVEFDQPLT